MLTKENRFSTSPEDRNALRACLKEQAADISSKLNHRRLARNRIEKCRDGQRRRPIDIEKSFASVSSLLTKELMVDLSKIDFLFMNLLDGPSHAYGVKYGGNAFLHGQQTRHRPSIKTSPNGDKIINSVPNVYDRRQSRSTYPLSRHRLDLGGLKATF